MKAKAPGVKHGSRHSVSAIFRPCVESRQGPTTRSQPHFPFSAGSFSFLAQFRDVLDLVTHPVARPDKRFLFVSQFVQQVVGHLHAPGPQLS